MVVGHIYVIDLLKTRPSYVAGLQRFLNAFSDKGGGVKSGWATQAKPNGMLEIAVREGKLDEEFHAYFFVRCKVREVHLTQEKSILMFPDEDLGNVNAETDPVRPGDPPREKAQKVNDPSMIAALKEQIDGNKGRK